MFCKATEDQRHCAIHGSRWPCTMIDVLRSVAEERARQFEHYGDNSEHADGTGPRVRWCLPVETQRPSIGSALGAEQIEKLFREDYENWEAESGEPVTWVHLIREEAAEAFKEDDPDRLEAEVVQIAALAVCWVEKIRERRQWGIMTPTGSLVTSPDWGCPADVMGGTHGFDYHGPYTVVYRYPDIDEPDYWREYR